MAQFRYDTTGTWLKGNTHIHSTASDGGKTFPELADMYAGAGYDFLCATDHGVPSDFAADPNDYPLLWLDGIELNGTDDHGASYHVVGLGTFHDLPAEGGFVASLKEVHAQGGLLIIAHPHWMGNTLEDALRWGFDGVEVYNHVCRWLNGKGDGEVYWSAMLDADPNTLSFSVDDAHVRAEHPGWNGGWVMVNVPECSREAIMAAIRTGNFYSTCGPVFESIEFDGTTVTARTSPVQFARLVGRASAGARVGSFEGELRTDVSLPIPEDWPYAVLEIEDAQGRRAWTNPLLVAEK